MKDVIILSFSVFHFVYAALIYANATFYACIQPITVKKKELILCIPFLHVSICLFVHNVNAQIICIVLDNIYLLIYLFVTVYIHYFTS